jgi:hypothetical protein
MRMAIDEARRADFPSGAVIVRDGAAAFCGRLMLGERVSVMTLIGLAAATCGVAPVWWRRA